MSDPLLRALVDLRDRQIQKARIQFSNRLSAIDRGQDDSGESQQTAMVMRWLDVFQTLEGQLDKDIAAIVKREAIFEEMSQLRGIGPLLAAKIIAMVDIERAQTISALWRYAGYGVKDGERERPVKGETLHYNIRLKTALYLVGTSFLRCGSPYRAAYDNAKSRYEQTRPDWTKAHIHQAAIAELVEIVPTEVIGGLSYRERAFGDYALGRFAWKLEKVQPIHVWAGRGQQGLWELNEATAMLLRARVKDL